MDNKFKLSGIAPQVLLGKSGKIFDGFNLFDRAGNNWNYPGNLTQAALDLSDGAAVEVAITDVGAALNSMAYVDFRLLVSGVSGRAKYTLQRAYDRRIVTAIGVHATDVDSTVYAGYTSGDLEFNQVLNRDDVGIEILNNTGETVRYSYQLTVTRHDR